MLVMMLAAAAVTAAGFLAEGAFVHASRTYGSAVLDLGSRSLLSEYDRALRERYGLFGVTMPREEAEEKLCKYAEAAFEKKRPAMDLLRLFVEDCRIDTSDHTLTDPGNLKGQILQESAWLLGTEAAEFLLGDEPTEYDEREARSTAPLEERRLENEAMRRELPSVQLGMDRRILPDIRFGPSDLLVLGDATRRLAEDLQIDHYILRRFRDRFDTQGGHETFFANEVEYILFGRYGDAENRMLVQASLLATRTALNLHHILQDPEKREAVRTLANLLTPGPEALATEGVLTGAWAAAEAALDVGMLEDGKRVPLLKTKDQWKCSLDYAVQAVAGPGSEDAEDTTGLTYEGYLFLFLCLRDTETKLVRIMDLIQLNLAGGHDGSFRVARCFTGLSYEVRVGNRRVAPDIRERRIETFAGSHSY